MTEFSPFAINVNNLAEAQIEEPEEQIQSEEKVETEKPIELKLDLPTNNTIEEPAFETVEVKHRPRVTVEEQAQAVLNNYLTTHPNLYPDGKTKRKMYREFLRRAKAGKFEKIFNSNL